ncbi:MAG TPA: chorismate synthase [bacterium]|jgi:chorismate synthase|nr:chorismate synthase [bacterium]
MSSIIGEKLKVSIFGQSHGEAIGVVMDGLPAGEQIELELLQSFLARRAPGNNSISSARKEQDRPRFLSGLVKGRTCGAPLCALIDNTDIRPQDYCAFRDCPRPSQSDYPARRRYRGWQDAQGGGHLSGRLTASLCIAGGVAAQILSRRGIYIGAHAEQIGSVSERRFSTVALTQADLKLPATRRLPLLDQSKLEAVEQEILAAAADGDSIGGVVECAAIGLPPGIGDPIFGGMENRLAPVLFGIPGVRGIEFGSGFAAAKMKGSEHNDPYRISGGKVITKTNHHGGILAGITTGMPLIFRLALKPTPSITKKQQTIDLATMTETTIEIDGRHDPCIVLRAVPCVEAATAIVLLDSII